MTDHARPFGSERFLRLGLAALTALLLTVPATAGEQGSEKAKPQPSKTTAAKPAAKPAAEPASGAAAKPAVPPVSPFLAAARSKAVTDADVVVITNDDLSKLSGGGVYVVKPAVSAESAAADAADASAASTEPSPAEAPADVDPLVWMQQQREQKQQQADAVAEARKKVGELEARKAELEKRLRAVRNPYLPRPQVTEKEDEGHGTKWNDLSGPERVSRTETELQQVEDELAAARTALDAAGS
jgi:hypothetical protein